MHARRAATPPTSAASSAPSASTASSASRGRCVDPTTKEILGYEATYVGALEYTVQGEHAHRRRTARPRSSRRPSPITSIRMEAGVGDRLAPVPAREYTNYAPHPPAAPIARPDRLDLRRRPDGRPEPDRRAQPRRWSTASSAATCSRSIATARSSSTRPKSGAHEDQAARRAPRRAVRVPRLRAHVVRADPVGEASRSRPATASPSPRLARGPLGRDRTRFRVASRAALRRPRQPVPT